MAIIKVTYTKNKTAAKKTVRYLVHRPDRDRKPTSRELFGTDGELTKQHAYRLIDQAQKGTTFFRIVISPDPATEDKNRDLYLSDVAHLTIAKLEKRKKQEISYVVVEHNDHAPHRHVHIVAHISGKLTPYDFKFLRETATNASLIQRQERDMAQEAREIQQRQKEEAQWAI